MDLISQHVATLTPHYMLLLQVLAVITYLIHLPYAGLVLGSTILSLWLSFSDRDVPNAHFERFAGEIIDAFLKNRLTMFVLGIAPLLVLPLIYLQWFAHMDATPLKYIPLSIPFIVVGYVLVALYAASYPARRTNWRTHAAFGVLGVLVLLASYFVLIGAVARLNDPEKWFRVTNLGIMLLNWNVIWRFLFVLHAGLAATGAIILFFFFRWRRMPWVTTDPEYAGTVKRFGAGIALSFTLGIPVYWFLYVFTSPDIVFDNVVYLMATGVIFICLVAALVLLGVLNNPRPRFGATTFGIFMFLFLTTGVVNQRAMINANAEHVTQLAIKAEKERSEREAKIEAVQAQQGGVDLGEQTFHNVCMQCHRFDKKLVGPPLAQVLPKYAGQVEKLKAFLKNPKQNNPGYPPMPNPGLTSVQRDAVAKYVLEQVKKQGAGQ